MSKDITAEEFDEKLDNGEDVLEYIDREGAAVRNFVEKHEKILGKLLDEVFQETPKCAFCVEPCGNEHCSARKEGE